MINQFTEQEEHRKENPHTYIVIGFKETIIKIEKSIFSLQQLLSFNSNIKICFLSKIDDINVNNNLRTIELDSDFQEEIKSFNKELFLIKSSDAEVKNIWKSIKPCISGYLIRESYEKTKINRLDDFINFEQRKEKSETTELSELSEPLETTSENFSSNKIPIIKDDDFIELRNIGSGSSFEVVLIYHIERGKLYALKKQNGKSNEFDKLIKREIDNYSKIQHPLMPKFIGVGQDNESLIIEFINGQTLLSIDELELNFSDKITIFFELMIIIEFLHRKGFIYRDLKPNNIMIDENKTAVLIDFDRIIEKKNSFDTKTNDFSSPYHAPEINFSYECDIYSLGHVFLYIMNPKIPFDQHLDEISTSSEFNKIKEIIKKSIKEEVKERPSILEMICKIYISYFKDIKNSNLFEIYITNLGEYYKNNKISKSNANQIYAEALFNLGLLYEEGELIPRDMNKSIHYYSLAVNQNHSKAQFNLGLLYEEGELIPRDMNKSIHYYSLAANQNYADAQLNLGLLYSEGELIPRDMNKSIHYYSLAANQNHSKAQFNLGLLYEEGKLIPRDMNKSIHYYSLAANQNDADAQFNLAIIYMFGKNDKKAIKYFALAAYHNSKNSLFFLALFNLKGLYVKKNPYNGITYMNQCLNIESKYFIESNFIVGYFHHVGLHVKRDIKRAIKCYKESSSFNYSLAKNNLGIIYKHGDDQNIKKELGWSIEYFKESIKYGDHPISMYNLAHLYFYENPIENSKLESIKLLIKSSNKNHYPLKFRGVNFKFNIGID